MKTFPEIFKQTPSQTLQLLAVITVGSNYSLGHYTAQLDIVIPLKNSWYTYILLVKIFQIGNVYN